MQKIIGVLVVLTAALVQPALAAKQLKTPAPGIVCDIYFCADKSGLSVQLTAKYIGSKAANRLKKADQNSLTHFTFSNGIYCDAEAKICRTDRYFDAKGNPSPLDRHYTDLLFGQ